MIVDQARWVQADQSAVVAFFGYARQSMEFGNSTANATYLEEVPGH